MTVRIDVLGAPRCFVADRELADLPAQRTRFALLVYLAIERDVARDELAALFWPDSSEERGRHALSQSLYELKRVVGEDWLTTYGTRLLITEQVIVDADRFSEHLKAGALQAALDLYRGVFLKAFVLPNNNGFENWVDRNRAHYERANRKARREYVEALIAENKLAHAIDGARAWVDVDPLDDEANHRLIELLANAGERAEALKVYARYEQALKQELSVVPLDHTRELVRALRDDETARVQPIPFSGAKIQHASSSVEEEELPALGLWAQLKQRHVPRMAAWYVATSLVILQGGEALREALLFPRWPLTVTAVLVVLGFPLTLVLSWYFEVTPDGRLVHDKRAPPLRSEWRVFLTALGITTSAILAGFIVPNVIGNASTEMVCDDGSVAPCERTVAIERNRFVVLPLIHAEGTEPHLLDGEMCARFLTDGLQHWHDINIVERPRVKEQLLALPAALRRHLPTDTALAIARRLGAGKLIMGELSHRRDSTAVDAYLYDVVTGRRRRYLPTRFASGSVEAEIVFHRLAQQFAISETGQKLTYSAGTSTRSAAAMNALDSALIMRDAWRLKEARTHLQSALARDPAYPHAHLELADLMLWQNDTSAEWRFHAEQAYESRRRLTLPDQLRASGLVHLVNRRYQQSCESYRELIARDRMSFFGWFGLGECLRRDATVVPDTTSPSGWSFVTSWQEAINAHNRALWLVPSFAAAFVNLGSTQLEKLLFTSVTKSRQGVAVQGDSARFAAWPQLDADTLALVPYPYSEWLDRPKSLTAHTLVQRHRLNWAAAVSGWALTQPNDARALEAYASALELTGKLLPTQSRDNSALGTLRRARKLNRDSSGFVRLAAFETRLLLKAGKFDEARSVALTALRDNQDPRPRDALLLAGLAGLAGRGNDMVHLLVTGADSADYDTPLLGKKVQMPPPLARQVSALLGYAYLGGPIDSIRVLSQRAHDALVNFAASDLRELFHQTALDRAARMTFPVLGVEDAHAKPGLAAPFIRAQAALARGETSAVRNALDEFDARMQRQNPTDFASDGVLTYAQLRVAIRDTAKAVAVLDRYLNDLHNLPRGHFTQPYQPVSIVRLMIIRADLAATASDRVNARKWSRAVLDLWRNGDPQFKPVLRRMRSHSRT